MMMRATAASCVTRSLLDLSSDIVLDILLRLPITSILRSRCVCKTLNRLLSDPYSAYLYQLFQRQYQQHPSQPRRNNVVTNLLLNRFGYEFHLMEYDSTLPSGSNAPTMINTKFDNTPSSRVIEFTVLLAGFCNGFLCLLDRFSLDRLFLTNPILGEFVIVPKHTAIREISKGVREVFGFGFSKAELHYKVMALSPSESISKKSEVRVLTLDGSHVSKESWRIVGNDAPFANHHGKLEWNANINGLVHYIHEAEGFYSESGPIDDFIYSFDFDEERVKSIPNPPVSGGFMYHLMSLGVLGNRLCIFLFDRKTKVGYVYVDIWSMKEYGIKESWTMVRIRVTSFPYGMEGKYTLRPVVLSRGDWEGDILMTCMHVLVYCDPKTGVLTRLPLAAFAVDHCFLASIFTPSFLSLKHVVMGGLRIHNVHPRGTPRRNEFGHGTERSENHKDRTTLLYRLAACLNSDSDNNFFPPSQTKQFLPYIFTCLNNSSSLIMFVLTTSPRL